ncbi:MAG: hypothetical protein R3247_09820, partial [Rhodothermales bacterium]|nr:hypothetical protein [Rhodothermales bacterium]
MQPIRYVSFALLLVILVLAGWMQPLRAQTPVLEVEDSGGATLLRVMDSGTLHIPIGAASGYVLTADANGYATWQAPSGGGFTLPYTGTASTGVLVPLMTLTQQGDGTAARFEIDNAASPYAPVFVTTNGSGPGLLVQNAGTGLGLRVEGRSEIERQDIGLPAAALNTNQTLTLEAADAFLGLYSDGGGAWGSGIELGQIVSDALSDKWALVRGAGAAPALHFTYGTDPSATANPSLMRILSTGKVGIGDGTPFAKLHVFGANESYNGFMIEADEGDRASLYYQTDVGVIFDSFRSSDNRRLPVLLQPNGGNVGIGTTTAGSPLTVAGIIESTTGGIKFPDGTIQTSAASGGGGAGWGLTGNAGTTPGTNFIGTTDPAAFEVHVDGVRGFRFEPATVSGSAHNLIGGHPSNSVGAGVQSATIGGGGFDNGSASFPNVVNGSFGTVAGGQGNTASAAAASIGGGSNNVAAADYATVSGGGASSPASGNRVYDDYGTVSGGGNNVAGTDDG